MRKQARSGTCMARAAPAPEVHAEEDVGGPRLLRRVRVLGLRLEVAARLGRGGRSGRAHLGVIPARDVRSVVNSTSAMPHSPAIWAYPVQHVHTDLGEHNSPFRLRRMLSTQAKPPQRSRRRRPTSRPKGVEKFVHLHMTNDGPHTHGHGRRTGHQGPAAPAPSRPDTPDGRAPRRRTARGRRRPRPPRRRARPRPRAPTGTPACAQAPPRRRLG